MSKISRDAKTGYFHKPDIQPQRNNNTAGHIEYRLEVNLDCLNF